MKPAFKLVPFNRVLVEYVEEEVEERVPVEVRKVVLEERRVRERVPVQRKVLDYYRVEHRREFVPQ
jgi:hypothetical protein